MGDIRAARAAVQQVSVSPITGAAPAASNAVDLAEKAMAFVARRAPRTPREKAEAHLAKLEEKQAAILEKATGAVDSESINITNSAFVTFEHEESQVRCMDDYRGSGSRLGRRFQPSHLRFSQLVPPQEGEPQEGGTAQPKDHALYVSQAPEPDDVRWENLDYSDDNRLARRRVNSLLMVICILCSFGIVFIATAGQRSAIKQIPSLAVPEVRLSHAAIPPHPAPPPP